MKYYLININEAVVDREFFLFIGFIFMFFHNSSSINNGCEQQVCLLTCLKLFLDLILARRFHVMLLNLLFLTLRKKIMKASLFYMKSRISNMWKKSVSNHDRVW